MNKLVLFSFLLSAGVVQAADPGQAPTVHDYAAAHDEIKWDAQAIYNRMVYARHI